MNKLLEIYTRWSDKGFRAPFMHDPVTKKPSATLLIFYVMFVLMLTSLILLHFDSSFLIATGTTIIVWTISYVMYRIRHLDKFKVNLQESELEFHSSEEQKTRRRRRK